MLALSAIFILAFVFSVYISKGVKHEYVIGSDGLSYYAQLRSLMIDKDLDFKNEFRDYNPHHHGVPDYTKTTITGHVANKYPIGQAILWLPFFLIAHLSVLILNLAGFRILQDGYSFPYQVFIGFGSVVYGMAGLFLIYKTLARYYKKDYAALAVFLVLLGTNLHYYFVWEPTMVHLSSMFVVSLFIYLFLVTKGTSNPRRFIILGAIYGLMIIVRYQNALFGAIVLLEYTDRETFFPWKKTVRGLLYGVAGFLFFFIPQMVFWKIIFGRWVLYSYENECFDFFHPHFLWVLFSSRHGLIRWTPMVLIFCTGLFFVIQQMRWLGIVSLCIFLSQLYVNSSWWCWWFGASYGSRAFIECSFIFCLGMAAFLNKIWNTTTQRGLFISVAAVLILLNFIQSANFTYHFVPGNGYGDWIDLIKPWLSAANK
jgi:hypothetical protein